MSAVDGSCSPRTRCGKCNLPCALPLAGLLIAAPEAFAHGNSWEHRQIHRDLGAWHDEFHQFPHSRREHRRFHRELRGEHRALDRDLRNGWGRYGYDRYGYGRSYDDDPSGGSPSDQYGYGGQPYYGDPYGYGGRPYYGGGAYPGSPYPDPSSTLPSLFGLPLDILLPRYLTRAVE